MVIKVRRISATQLQALNRAGISVALIHDTPKPKDAELFERQRTKRRLKLIQGGKK